MAKVRPCLVVSIRALNQDRALATLIPHTTSPRGSRFEVDVKARFLKPGVFDVQNIITIPHAKLLRKLGELNSDLQSHHKINYLSTPLLSVLKGQGPRVSERAASHIPTLQNYRNLVSALGCGVTRNPRYASLKNAIIGLI